jgi:hypothetical protein
VPKEGTQFEDSTALWITNAAGTYNVSEKSYIYSPAFDLSSIQKPSLSFDLWLNTVEGSDGLVIEYSTDQSKTIENNGDWKTIGQIGSGLNWLNNSDLRNTISIQSGWSGAFSEEDTENTNTIRLPRNAKNELFEILDSVQTIDLSSVVFRFKFESSSAIPKTGVAIDNFIVESLNRTMLVEYFGDVSTATDEAEMNQLQVGSGGSASFAWINYRINEADALYSVASSGIVSRTFFYDAFEPQNNFSLDGLYSDALFSSSSNDLSKRALVSSIFELGLVTEKVEESLQVSVAYNLIEGNAFPENTRLMVAILNDTVNIEDKNYFNVLQTFLPDAQGFKVSESGTKTLTYTPKTALGSSNLMVVAFLQSFDPNGNRMVYQTASAKDLPVIDFTITGRNKNVLNDLRVYPNPASELLNFSFIGAHEDLTIRLYEPTGKQVGKLSLEANQKVVQLNILKLSSGLYTIVVRDAKGNYSNKKIVIKH